MMMILDDDDDDDDEDEEEEEDEDDDNDEDHHYILCSTGSFSSWPTISFSSLSYVKKGGLHVTARWQIGWPQVWSNLKALWRAS